MSDLFQRLSSHIGRIKVRSIIDAPAKYLLWIILFAIVAAIAEVSSWVIIVLFCFAGAFLLLVLVGYIYFALTKPDYLRSEEYNLKKKSLEIMGDKENYLPVDMHNVVNVVNTTASAILLEDNEEEENHE
jgi:hypothetical protein